MMVISFIWGQKQYPVPYVWKKLVAYIIISVCIFFIHSTLIKFYSSLWFSLLIATFLFSVFSWFIFLVERNEIKKLPVIGKYF